jgi:subtilisin family serine protease
MARFIVASRQTGSDQEETDASQRAFSGFRAKLGPRADVPPEEEHSRIGVWEGDGRQFAALRAEFGEQLIVEEETQRYPCIVHPLASPLSSQPRLSAGLGGTLELDASSDGGPVRDALTLLYLQSARGAPPTTAVGTTDAYGHTVLPFDASMWMPVAAAVMPRAAAWAALTQITGPSIRLTLPALPRTGPLAWWHQVLGINSNDPSLGEGVRVGIVDSGVGDHPYLEHARRVGAFLNGTHDPSPEASEAVSDHGTHVAGIIGARPTDRNDFIGIAQGAELVVARVYPGSGPPGMESGPATNGDIAQAILSLSRDEECDLINVSSAGLVRSEIEASRINAAAARGTLVICSVGNGGGPPVMFPAAEAPAIGVTALGLINTAPFGVLDSMNLPQAFDRYAPNGIYSPTFASLGIEVKCAGPGVGIISTVPPFGESKAPYAAMSGTSMAAPAVTGALAAVLSRDPTYRTLPRSIERSRRAAILLTQSLRSVGLSIPYQGFGLPYVQRQ